MHNNDRRLIDEALDGEPIKNTFRLSWEFITLNRHFTLTAMSLLLLLNILTAFLGLLAMVLSGIFSMAIQIYVARLFYGAEDINAFIHQVKEGKVEKALAPNVGVATGAYFGEMLLLFLFLFLLFMLVQTSGVALEDINELKDLQPLLQVIFFPLMLVLLLVSYIHPLVQAKITMANSFQEGFLAVFSIFSLRLWQQSLHRSYMRYIIIIMALTLVGALFVGLLITIPFLNLLGGFIVIVVMYIYMILSAMVSMMGKRVVEEMGRE